MFVTSSPRRLRTGIHATLVATLVALSGCATEVSPDDGGRPHDAAADTQDAGNAVPAGALATHVVADANLTCAIGDDARVRCWGAYQGFVFSVGRSAGAAPTLVPGVEGATSIALSSDHVCAVVTGGDVLCWGFNTSAQLGLPRENPAVTDAFHAVPVRVVGLPPASAVAVGWQHSCALLVNGGVACWGDDQLSEQPVPIPMVAGWASTATPVVAPGVTDVAQLDAHRTTTCVRHHDGSVQCWGDGTLGGAQRIHGVQVPPVIDVYANELASYALGSNGTVYRWAGAGASPPGDGLAQPIGTLANATRIVSITPRICALDTRGALVCLDPPDFDRYFRPELAATLAALPLAREVAIGWQHACAIDLSGHLSCLGENPIGQVGVGSQGTTTADTARVALHHASHVVRGAEFTCALASDGLSCWGGNRSGDVGVGGAPYAAQSTPVRVSLDGVTDVAARLNHACAVAGVQVYCWGDNTHGEVVRGGPVDVPMPLPVALPAPAHQVAVGDAFVCARTDGGVYCWGDDTHGQAGDAAFPSTIGPTLIALPGQAATIVAGALHACAALTDGEVYCWGDNSALQVAGTPCDALCRARVGAGDGRHAHAENAPVLVPGVTHAGRLVALDTATCAFDESGASCWGGGITSVTRFALPGASYAGTLDNVTVCGSSLAACMPVAARLPSLASVTDVTFDSDSGCAIASTGDLECWGDGSRGQLGTGDGYFGTPAPVTW